MPEGHALLLFVLRGRRPPAVCRPARPSGRRRRRPCTISNNATIELEEPVVAALPDGVPAGRALDAGCGTGRHTARLAAAGHDVVGIDPSGVIAWAARRP